MRKFSLAFLIISLAALVTFAANDTTALRISEIPSASYRHSYVSATYGTNLGQDDHVQFDTDGPANGSTITRDPNIAGYVAGNNAQSRGRFVLTGGHTYKLEAAMNALVCTVGVNTCGICLSWVDATDGSVIGQGACFLQQRYNFSRIDLPEGSSSQIRRWAKLILRGILPTAEAQGMSEYSFQFNSNSIFTTVFAPGSDTRIDLRIHSSGDITTIGRSTTTTDGGTLNHLPQVVITQIN